MPAPLLRRYLPQVVAVPLSYAVYSGMTGQIGEYTRICSSTLRLLPRMLHKRRVIQSCARRSADEIRARLT